MEFFYDSKKSEKRRQAKKTWNCIKIAQQKNFIFLSDKFCVFFAGSRREHQITRVSKCLSAPCVSAAVEEQEEEFTDS